MWTSNLRPLALAALALAPAVASPAEARTTIALSFTRILDANGQSLAGIEVCGTGTASAPVTWELLVHAVRGNGSPFSYGTGYTSTAFDECSSVNTFGAPPGTLVAVLTSNRDTGDEDAAHACVLVLTWYGLARHELVESGLHT